MGQSGVARTDRTNPARQASRYGTISRRTLLAGSALGMTALLAACGDDDDPEQANATETPEPTEIVPTATIPPLSSPVPGFLDPERWAGRSLTIATAAAGDFLDSLTATFFEPFALATGASVRHVQFGRDGIEGLIDQVENEENVWDVVLIPTGDVLGLTGKPYLEAIDYATVDRTAFYPELAMQHAVGAFIYSTVQVYPATEPDPPESWVDFWDLTRSQGTRALRRDPVGTLEFALLADGVAIADLYPLDTERAFASLERIREATLFYEDSKQPVELVRTGQVGLASAWNVRTALPDVASLVKITWSGGMISADSWAIPRSAENNDVAMSFLSFSTRAVTTANFCLMQPYGPANQDALALLPTSALDSVPNTPERLSQQFFQNFAYWNERREQLTAQFEEWWLNPPATPGASQRVSPSG
jgi:putative spermidine/putrescine transport system substrate-binding protein